MVNPYSRVPGYRQRMEEMRTARRKKPSPPPSNPNSPFSPEVEKAFKDRIRCFARLEAEKAKEERDKKK